MLGIGQSKPPKATYGASNIKDEKIRGDWNRSQDECNCVPVPPESKPEKLSIVNFGPSISPTGGLSLSRSLALSKNQ